MRILSNVAISGNLNLGSSNKKDTFIIGSPDLENNNVNTDVFTVWANADFKNNVQLGANSSDLITVSGTLSASNGSIHTLTSSIVSSSNLYLDEFTLAANTLQTGYLEVVNSTSLSGNIYVSGNIVPALSATFSLGSLQFPFKEIYVGSGSISIKSPFANVAATTISNNSGNLEISAGGIRLLGTGSFIAATGSFQYVSGNVYWEGSNTTNGTTTTNELHIKNNLIIDSGSNKPIGTAVLNGNNPGAQVTVTNSLVTTSSIIFLTKQTNNHGSQGTLSLVKSNGSFVIHSDHNGDSDTVAYMIVNN